ncbi:MAG: glucosaminidase domain-containing protein [Candidatus Gracilibacteria bacterium]|jgi:flagellum-specific peptidoglycan hydrolase FlgJ
MADPVKAPESSKEGGQEVVPQEEGVDLDDAKKALEEAKKAQEEEVKAGTRHEVGAVGVDVKTGQAKEDLRANVGKDNPEEPVGEEGVDPEPDADEDPDANTGMDLEDSEDKDGIIDKIVKHYEAIKGKDSSFRQTLLALGSSLVFAITEGGSSVWNWISNLWDRKNKEEKPTVPDEEKPPENTTYEASLDALLVEFKEEKESDPKKNFVKVAKRLAEEVEKKFGIPWKVCFGQACLESGYGQSGLTQDALNCFGMKTGKRYTGEKVTMMTWEEIDGKRVKIPADFRKYSDIRASFMSYGRNLTENPVYKDAFQYKYDSQKFLETIASPYATGSGYVASVSSLLEKEGISLA